MVVSSGTPDEVKSQVATALAEQIVAWEARQVSVCMWCHRVCERIVAWEIITISNVCDLSTHAFAANAEQLIDVCIHCLRELVDAVRDTEGWSNLPPSIIDDVLVGDEEVKKRRRMAARQRERDAAAKGAVPGE